MLLIIAFALFILLIAAWITMPAASAVKRIDEPLAAGMPAMGSHTV